MTRDRIIARVARRVAGFRRDEAGATLVEFGIVIALMLLMGFAIIDFGRLAFHYVCAQKAVDMAARVAAVRPAACEGLPTVNTRGVVDPDEPLPQFGTACGSGADICSNPGSFTCEASVDDDTSEEVWRIMSRMLPPNSAMEDVLFRYDYDADLGFLGGPYIPYVTVQIQNVEFNFISPIGQLAALAIGGATAQTEAFSDTITFPELSSSMPGEDLGQGGTG